MGNVLNMNTKLAMNKLTRLSKGLSKEHNVPFGLDKKMSIFDGKTYNNDGLSLSAFFRLAADEYMNTHNW